MKTQFFADIESQLITVFLSLFLLTLTIGFSMITGYILMKRCKSSLKKSKLDSRFEGNITVRIEDNTIKNRSDIDDLEFFEIRSDIESIDFSYEEAKKKANVTIKSNIPEIEIINEFSTMPNRLRNHTRAKRSLLAEFNANSGANFNGRYMPKRVFSASFFENL